MPLFVLLCITLISTSHSGNILVIAGVRGSHLYLSTEVADKLVDFGHNVTVVALYGDNRVDMRDRAFHFITLASENETEALFENFDNNFGRMLHFPSIEMLAEFYIRQVKDEEFKFIAEESTRLAMKYFNGKEFAELLDNANFDLAVIEDHISPWAIVSLMHRDIPKMGIYCLAAAGDVNNRYGLPGLINSVPSFTNDVTNSPPNIFERLDTLTRLGRLFSALYSIIQLLIIKDGPSKTQLSFEDFFIATYDVVFVNDHPAFSFPFLSPPNTFYLGTFNLEDRPLRPLPNEFRDFLTNCPHQRTVLFSFGTYLHDITKFSGTTAILETLRRMDVCVIMRSEIDLSKKFDLPAEKFLQRSWIPQKDLLGSGQLDFFISHCGNNGRLEAIFYNVPLLCIPLMGDQYYNARLVERNGFGLLLPWESLSEETFTETVDRMLDEQNTLVTNMKRAVEIARQDPGAGSEMLRYYTDLLVKNGNADYLVNRIILNQSTIEIYNLDIVAVALVVVISGITGILFCLTKCFKLCKNSGKFKSD